MSGSQSRPVLPSNPLPPGTKCPVCLEDIVNVAYTNECLHFFCLECIDEWLAEHNQCPLCRRRIRFLCYNLRGPSDYDTRAVLPPLTHPQLLIQFGRNRVLVTTPPQGLYRIYPHRAINDQVFYAVEFLEPGLNHRLAQEDPSTMYVLPEDFEAVVSRLEDLGLQRYVPDPSAQPTKTNSRARMRERLLFWSTLSPF